MNRSLTLDFPAFTKNMSGRLKVLQPIHIRQPIYNVTLVMNLFDWDQRRYNVGDF